MRAWNRCFGKLRAPRLWEAGGILPEMGRDLAEVGAAMAGSALLFRTPLQPVECSKWQGAGRAREPTQQKMSGDIWAGSGIAGNCMEPALPIRPASRAAVSICRVWGAPAAIPGPLGPPGRGTRQRSRTLLVCPQQSC